MKKKVVLLVISGLFLVTCVVIVVAKIATHYLGTRTAAYTATITCARTFTAQQVTIVHNTMNPVHIRARRCDTLTVTNLDAVTREIAFGTHDHHQAYDGITEKELQKSQGFTFTLNQAGTYTFHDHFHDEVAGDFSVSD